MRDIVDIRSRLDDRDIRLCHARSIDRCPRDYRQRIDNPLAEVRCLSGDLHLSRL